MRISDWSSDVCSSDLRDTSDVAFGLQFGAGRFFTRNFSLDAEFNYMNPQKNNNDLLFTNYGASLDGRYHFIQDGRSWNPYLLLGAGLLHHAEEFELISNPNSPGQISGNNVEYHRSKESRVGKECVTTCV